MIRIIPNVSRTTKTIIKSELFSRSMMIIIVNIDSEIKMSKLYMRTSLTRSVVTDRIKKLQDFNLIKVRVNGRSKIIIPTTELIEIRKRLISLVRFIEEVGDIYEKANNL